MKVYAAGTEYDKTKNKEHTISGPKPIEKLEGENKHKEKYNNLDDNGLIEHLHKNVDKLAKIMKVGKDSPEYKRAHDKIDNTPDVANKYRANIYQTAAFRDDSARLISSLQSEGKSIDEPAFGKGSPLEYAMDIQDSSTNGRETVKKLLEYGANTKDIYNKIEEKGEVPKKYERNGTFSQLQTAVDLDSKIDRVTKENNPRPIGLITSSFKKLPSEDSKDPDAMKRFISRSSQQHSKGSEAQKKHIENLYLEIKKNPEFKDRFEASFQEIKEFQEKSGDKSLERIEAKLNEKSFLSQSNSQSRDNDYKHAKEASNQEGAGSEKAKKVKESLTSVQQKDSKGIDLSGENRTKER